MTKQLGACQSIMCSVSSCSFYENNNTCSLEAIQISPCPHVDSGDPEHETNCASYKHKGMF